MKLTVVIHSKVAEFIKAMPAEARAKVYWVIDLLEEFGLGVGRPYVAYLSEGIWELRVTWRNVNYRFLFFPEDSEAVIVNALVKKTSQVPAKDIRLAKARRSEYWNTRSKRKR
jgi:Phage-related protein